MFTQYNYSNIFKILPNVLDPSQMERKSIQICGDLENELQIPNINLFELGQPLKTSHKKNLQHLMWKAAT